MWYPSPFSAIGGVSLRVSRMGPTKLTCIFSSHSSGSPNSHNTKTNWNNHNGQRILTKSYQYNHGTTNTKIGVGAGGGVEGETGVCMKASGQVHYHCRQCMLIHSSCHFSVSVMLQMCTHQECTFGAQICAGITRTYILFAMQFQCEHTFQGGLPSHGKDASTVDQHINAFVPLQQCWQVCQCFRKTSYRWEELPLQGHQLSCRLLLPAVTDPLPPQTYHYINYIAGCHTMLSCPKQ